MEKRAAIYCRLSREDDNLACDEVSESIQNQQKLLCEYAKKNGFSVYCMYVDENAACLRMHAGDVLTRFFAKTSHVLLGIWRRLSII